MHDHMRKKLLNKDDISPACAYCLHGKMSPGNQSVLCIKKGVMLPTSSCNKFVYDPLKRRPQRMPKLPKMESEDFEL